MKPGNSSPTIETMSAVIAHSQIVIAQPRCPAATLPAGYDYADIAVLDWIALEGGRLGQSLLPI